MRDGLPRVILRAVMPMFAVFELPRSFALALAMMNTAVPSEQPLLRHGELATAIASECEAETFAEGDLASCIADTVALGTFESSLDNHAVGDGGHSVGAFQIYDGDRAILDDVVLSVKTAHRMMRQSRRVDPKHRFAFYARGPRYKSAEAQALSDHRAALAARLRKITLP